MQRKVSGRGARKAMRRAGSGIMPVERGAPDTAPRAARRLDTPRRQTPHPAAPALLHANPSPTPTDEHGGLEKVASRQRAAGLPAGARAAARRHRALGQRIPHLPLHLRRHRGQQLEGRQQLATGRFRSGESPPPPLPAGMRQLRPNNSRHPAPRSIPSTPSSSSSSWGAKRGATRPPALGQAPRTRSTAAAEMSGPWVVPASSPLPSRSAATRLVRASTKASWMLS